MIRSERESAEMRSARNSISPVLFDVISDENTVETAKLNRRKQNGLSGWENFPSFAEIIVIYV